SNIAQYTIPHDSIAHDSNIVVCEPLNSTSTKLINECTFMVHFSTDELNSFDWGLTQAETIEAAIELSKNPYARLKTAKAHYILGTYQANLRMKLQASETEILKTNAQKILVPSIIL
ncbi:hypothetical protein ACJX0J_020874, partial [Zea mays]